MAFQPGNDVYSANTGLSTLDVTFPHIDTRDPTAYDVNFSLGKRWINRASGNSFTLVSQSSIGGTLQSTWNAGGINAATTTTLGTVYLSTLAQLEAGSAPSGAYVPLANDVFTFVNSVAISGGTPATTAAQGFVYLATNAQAAAGSLTTNYAINPGSLAYALANGGLAIGSVVAGTGAFTTLAASSNATVGGTLGVTGTSTIAALSATTGTFSSTLGVTGAVTLSSSLGVTGTSTIAALSATTGTFSSTLGVTGAVTLSSTLGVSGTSTIAALSATTGAFSSTLQATGTTTLTALTQAGTALINSTGNANTTMGNAAGSGTVTIAGGTGGLLLKGGHVNTVTTVNHAASPYTVLTTDQIIATDSTAGTITINLPNAPVAGRTLVIYDSTGQAAAHNVTITTPGATTTISGAGVSGTSIALTTAYQSINLYANTTSNYMGQLIT